MDHSNILGVVLAGGKSQRFGEDKCQVKLGDKLLIDYILSEIIDEFKEILLISNNKIKYNNSNKISLVEDLKRGLGPLGGILTAMKWIKKNNRSYKIKSCRRPQSKISDRKRTRAVKGRISLQSREVLAL